MPEAGKFESLHASRAWLKSWEEPKSFARLQMLEDCSTVEMSTSRGRGDAKQCHNS